MGKGEQVRLNIGAGTTYIPGFVNIDISEKADVTLDLSKDSLPFGDDSVDLIFSYHTLEHVSNYLLALSEIHRVLKHGGHLLLGLPYVTLTEYHLVNPFHLHNFSEHSFDFFDPDRLKGSAAEGNPILFKKVFHRLYYIGAFHFAPPPLRTWCRRHLFNVVRQIDYGLVALKRVDLPILGLGECRDQMKQEFEHCMRSRVFYEPQVLSKRDKRLRFLKQIGAWWLGYHVEMVRK